MGAGQQRLNVKPGGGGPRRGGGEGNRFRALMGRKSTN